MGSMVYGNGPGGYSLTTNTAGSGLGVGNNDDLLNFARIMAQRNAQDQDSRDRVRRADAEAARAAELAQQSRMLSMRPSAPAAPVDPNASLRTAAEAAQLRKYIDENGTPWYTAQGAARGSRGVIGGPGIVPGYGAPDPMFLPPSMRPQAATMIPSATHVPTGTVGMSDEDASAAGRARSGDELSRLRSGTEDIEAARRRREQQMQNQMYGRF